MRVIVVLFAAILVMVAAGPTASASPDTASAVVAFDDGPEIEPMVAPQVLVAPVAAPLTLHSTAVPAAPPSGRSHAVLVFRPPRSFASR